MLSNHHLALISQLIPVNFSPGGRQRKSEQTNGRCHRKSEDSISGIPLADMKTASFEATRWNLNATDKESREDHSEVKTNLQWILFKFFVCVCLSI